MIETGGVDIAQQLPRQPGILLQQGGHPGEGELLAADQLQYLLHQLHVRLGGTLVDQLGAGEKTAGEEVDPASLSGRKSPQVSMSSAIRLCSVGWRIPSSPIQNTSSREALNQRGSRWAPCTANRRR